MSKQNGTAAKGRHVLSAAEAARGRRRARERRVVASELRRRQVSKRRELLRDERVAYAHYEDVVASGARPEQVEAARAAWKNALRAWGATA